MSRIQRLKARRVGISPNGEKKGAPVRRPCGCRDVAAIARASAEIVGDFHVNGDGFYRVPRLTENTERTR